ncbi:hypothetical protein [Microcystis sp.]|uniref:hypothetical protein n=1 Tax=Microcystis sp. TaxID=1127 RepID=UPI00391C49DC
MTNIAAMSFYIRVSPLITPVHCITQTEEPQEVNLTIEENSESLISIMDKVGKKAQAKGLTEDKLTELLVDES